MFVKKPWKIDKKTGKKSISYEIVESYRQKGYKYSRHRVLANISKLPLPI